jgi:hypothetical protein
MCSGTPYTENTCGECQTDLVADYRGNFPVDLGAAACFVVLASSALTSTGDNSFYGDVGSAPTPAITGVVRSPGLGYGVMWGYSIYGPAPTLPTAAHVAFMAAQAAILALADDMPILGTARFVAFELVNPRPIMTFTPGIYSASTTFAIGPAGAVNMALFPEYSNTVPGSAQCDMWLDGGGDDKAVFIFKIGSTLSVNIGCRVMLKNGAQAKNVFWRVGTACHLLGNTVFEGTVIAGSAINAGTAGVGFDTVVHGRLFAGSAISILGQAGIGGSQIFLPET